MLKKLGHFCDTASNGLECLNAVEAERKSPYSIIFMDIQMPVLDGLETTKRIINQYPNNHPPIIAMTANAFKEDKDKCREAGMVDFLSKPLKVSEFERILNKFYKADESSLSE